MREFKCRAWDKINKRMIYRVIVGDTSTDDPCSSIFCDNKKEFLHFDKHCGEIMQYIGRKDKYNKKIYEDDFVDVVMHEGVCNPSTKYLIEYRNAGFYLKAKNIEGDIDYVDICGYDCCIKSMEIIGNKHENPELSEDE